MVSIGRSSENRRAPIDQRTRSVSGCAGLDEPTVLTAGCLEAAYAFAALRSSSRTIAATAVG